MSTIAAAAQTADRIDYWIRRHVSQYCYGTHPSQSQTKFNSARYRRVALLGIGQCLKDQYDALASLTPRHLAALLHQLETQRQEESRFRLDRCESKNRVAHHV
jgi:hypothetical protein